MKVFFAAIMAISCSFVKVQAQDVTDAVAPETQSALASKIEYISPAITRSFERKMSGEPVLAHDWMVVAANPYATDAGAQVLRNGGTAADAMVAVQAVLGLVEPQSSGIGGERFWSGMTLRVERSQH